MIQECPREGRKEIRQRRMKRESKKWGWIKRENRLIWESRTPNAKGGKDNGNVAGTKWRINSLHALIR